MKFLPSITIALITLLGTVIRLVNISPFKFYPDAYESLLVAENIWNNHGVFGTLGKEGMFFPDFFAWTRPGYPLLIDFFKLFLHDTTFSAQVGAILMGILAIPLAYIFVRKAYKSTTLGLYAAFLIAISYNATVWGGFIFTETTGIFVLIAFLWSMFLASKRSSIFFDILTGTLFAATILTRYEYATLAIPLTFYLFQKNKNLFQIFTIFAAAFFLLALVVSRLFPISYTISLLLSQTQDMFWKAFLIVITVIGVFICYKLFYQKIKKIEKYIPHIFLLISMSLLFCIFQPFFPALSFLTHDLYGIHYFLMHDFLLVSMSLLGFYLLVKDHTRNNLVILCGLSIIIFLIIYHKLNPEIERYFTHLIPFLLIPAGFGFSSLVNKQKYSIKFLLLGIILLQIYFSITGMKFLNNGEWFKKSYEEVSTKIITKKLTDANALLLVSFPEPYYYFSHRPVYSITNKSPYMYINSLLDGKRIFIIEDKGMRDIFPIFSHHLESSMKENIVDSFFIHETYHYIKESQIDKQPIIIYATSVKQLKQKIIDW